MILSILLGMLFAILIAKGREPHGPNSRDIIGKKIMVDGEVYKWEVKRV